MEKLEFVVNNVPVDLNLLCELVNEQFRENGFPGLLISAQETSDQRIKVECISIAALSKHGDYRKAAMRSQVKNYFTSEHQIKDFIVGTCLQYVSSEAYFLATLIDKILEVQDRDDWSEEMKEIYYDWFLPVKYSRFYKQFQ